MKKEMIIIAILILLAIVCAYFIGVKEEEYTGGYNTYTVMPNDTLWSIAEDVESDKDIREVIHMIREDNGLTDSSINAWQELQLREEY